MTARVIPISRSAGRGRQPVEVEQRRDLRDELVATVLEDVDHARELLLLTRSAMRAVAAGRSPADDLTALERLVIRLAYQRGTAAAGLRADEVCPDGADLRHVGHGAAA